PRSQLLANGLTDAAYVSCSLSFKKASVSCSPPQYLLSNISPSPQPPRPCTRIIGSSLPFSGVLVLDSAFPVIGATNKEIIKIVTNEKNLPFNKCTPSI